MKENSKLIDANKLTADCELITSHLALLKKCHVKHTNSCLAPSCEDCMARLFLYHDHLLPIVTKGVETYTCPCCKETSHIYSTTMQFCFCPVCGTRMTNTDSSGEIPENT